MILWCLICLIVEGLRRRKFHLLSSVVIIGFFVSLFFLSTLSTFLFSFSGDEILYLRCGLEFSSLISQGQFWEFTGPPCDQFQKNFFVKLSGYVFYLAGPSYHSLIGFNAFSLYLACQFCLSSFSLSSVQKEKAFKFLLYSPPIVYLGLRPAKEALVAFLISVAFYAVAIRNRMLQVLTILSVLFLFCLVRWQYALAFISAMILFLIWCLFVRISDQRRLPFFIALAVLFVGFFSFFKDDISSHLYSTMFQPHKVQEFSNQPDGALIYRIMLNKEGVRSLHPWNIVIAHIGGFFTPHPLRFVREYFRDYEFDYHIFEEFLFVSFWFYLLLPLFVLYIIERFLKKFKAPQEINKSEVFMLTFVSLLFSLACFSLLLETPQLFRYKVPLNVYLFSAIIVYISQSGIQKVKYQLQKHSRWLVVYTFIVGLYSVVYLSFW